MPGAARRAAGAARDRARRWAAPRLQRLLERAAPGRTVMVSEYPVQPRARWGWGEPSHPELASLLADGDARYNAVVDRLLEQLPALKAVPRSAPPPSPSWDNDYWGGLDAAFHLVSLLERDPATYLEIGSGYSTMLARHTIDTHGLRTKIVSIDPMPRAEVDGLCDTLLRQPLEEVGAGITDMLVPGDVVLIDGSHVAFMGTDATVALLELLPRIPAGVLVGIDDVFLPWDYHPTWAGRWYAEQYVLAGFLLGGGGGWQVEFPGLHVTQLSPIAERLEPVWDVVETHFGRVAVTFWMERLPVQS